MHILPVKPYLGPHQYLCSPQDSSPVKIKHDVIDRDLRIPFMLSRLFLVLFLAFSAGAIFAQTSQTIESIRVIGNRRIPKETILARLFTHFGDIYDPVSIERDFNSLWNTGYFENLRIEREDSEKGIILDVFVKEKPTIREINYKGSIPSPRPTSLTDSRKKRSASPSRASTIRPRLSAPRRCSRRSLPSTATSSPPSRRRSRPFLRLRCRSTSTSRKAQR